MKSLAVKYRPQVFEDITEQEAIKVILQNQIDTGTVKHGYLFCGPAGCGKTTAARIFANEVNQGVGSPIELDAASNNSVDDIRKLCDDAQTMSLISEYKVYIIDECHSLSNQAWQAFLKTLEEPPVKSIFILCTTDPQKIPMTILSRVQRYNFQKISTQGIENRLMEILSKEGLIGNSAIKTNKAVEFIAKLAEGGMRDGITLLDKCLSYSNELTVDSVVKALSVTDYGTLFKFNDAFFNKDDSALITLVNEVYDSGADLKLFVKTYFDFILDSVVLSLTGDTASVKIPESGIEVLRTYGDGEWDILEKLLKFLVDFQSAIKYEQNPKPVVLAKFLLFNEDKV